MVHKGLESEDAFDHVVFAFRIFDNVPDTRLDTSQTRQNAEMTDDSEDPHYLYVGFKLSAKYTQAIESLELCIDRAESVRTPYIHERANSCIAGQILATTRRRHAHPL